MEPDSQSRGYLLKFMLKYKKTVDIDYVFI